VKRKYNACEGAIFQLSSVYNVTRNVPRNEYSIPAAPPEENERCQARPAAARRGFREDVLCASNANTVVEFRDQMVAVCRMHEATYRRWGEDAEANAKLLWEWPA
jgi:hypothetical protein